MITFSCEFCARKYRVDDGLAGRKVKCKECGTEMMIPSGARASASATSAPKVDLYGLDEDDAPLPPPRRPGMPTESASPSRGGKRSSSGEVSQLTRFGFSLMAAGGLAFVLPLVGLQIKGLHALSPQAQMVGGVALLTLGLFLVMLGKVGILKGLGVTVGGAVMLLVLLVVAANVLGNRGNRAPAANLGPNFPAPPNEGGGPAFFPPGANPTRVTITGGRAMADRGPAGMGGMGVAFEIDYRLDNGAAGLYDLFIKSSRGVNQIVPPVHLMPSGTVSISVPMARREEGPFEAYFESKFGGPQTRASNSMALNWVDTPAPEPNNPFNPAGVNSPDPFNTMPGPPGFQPPHMPPMPPRPPMPNFGRRVGPR